jgi:hypothetical protein
MPLISTVELSFEGFRFILYSFKILAAGVLMLPSNMIAILEFPHPSTVWRQWFDADTYLLPVLVV